MSELKVNWKYEPNYFLFLKHCTVYMKTGKLPPLTLLNDSNVLTKTNRRAVTLSLRKRYSSIFTVQLVFMWSYSWENKRIPFKCVIYQSWNSENEKWKIKQLSDLRIKNAKQPSGKKYRTRQSAEGERIFAVPKKPKYGKPPSISSTVMSLC